MRDEKDTRCNVAWAAALLAAAACSQPAPERTGSSNEGGTAGANALVGDANATVPSEAAGGSGGILVAGPPEPGVVDPSVSPCRLGADGKCIPADANDQDGDHFPASQDCDDHDSASHPGAQERMCNGLDEDCSGADYCPPDNDGDGIHQPVDCNDEDPTINTLAVEIACNGVDENCDGWDDCDQDGDGVEDVHDCDAANPTISPLASEVVCDGIDQNCDGADCCDNDEDGDGSPCKVDCRDDRKDVYPGAPVSTSCYSETHLDINCDGVFEAYCGSG